MDRQQLHDLLNTLQSELQKQGFDDGSVSVAETGPFVGRLVSDALRDTKYPIVWKPLIERYKELLASKGESSLAVRFYCDLACTVLTKKLAMVDLPYLCEPPMPGRAKDESGNSSSETVAVAESEDVKLLREAHVIMATKYSVKMFNCVYECANGRRPKQGHAEYAASRLYAELYAESYGASGLMERDVFQIVRTWFGANVLRPERGEDVCNVAPGVPFLFCSHVYWLWLHLTAARVRDTGQDLLTVIYALDTIVYCGECKKHFLDMRSDFFDFDAENQSHFTRHANAELLFLMHNRVNARTGSSELDVGVLAEYRTFWDWKKAQ